MWGEYYEAFRTAFESAVKPGILLQYGPDWAFNQQIMGNLATFAALKNHSNTADMVALLTGPDGSLKTYRQWRKDVDSILGQYNENWLQAEHQTATASARMAEKWRNFQRRKATYPNLKYITQADERVRQSHRPLHGIVRPVDDPFWNVNYPPNGWRCRCDVKQTDEPISGDPGAFIPPQIWRQNVGRNADLFPIDHPYRDVAANHREMVLAQGRRLFKEFTKKEILGWGLKNLRNREFRLPGLPGPATMSRSNIKEIIHKPHRHENFRNALLYIISDLIERNLLVLIKRSRANPGKHPEAAYFFYYLVKMETMEFYINVMQYKRKPEDIRIYAITDSIR